MDEKLKELEKRIMAIENILNIRKKFERETGRDIDMHILMPEGVIERSWK